MYCCSQCFGDRFLRKTIRDRSTQIGKCSYCESDNVPLLKPPALRDYFEALLSAYRTDPSGKPIAPLFREEWGLFKNSRMDEFRTKDLMAEILDDHDIVRQLFLPVSDPGADWLSAWEKLRDELMYQNRFFPSNDIDRPSLKNLLVGLMLEPDEFPSTWYRARIQTEDSPFLIDKMGAPPNKSAAHGRANPAGIPYLYLASQPLTAISEVRPHTGEKICVADFQITPNLHLIDLRNPRETISPFDYIDADQIAKIRSALPFLERLGNDLTVPVLAQAAAIEYTPSQYLCEFIKHCGYDGVIYRSSVSDGINLALFDPSRAAPGAVIQYKVTRVSVQAVP